MAHLFMFMLHIAAILAYPLALFVTIPLHFILAK